MIYEQQKLDFWNFKLKNTENLSKPDKKYDWLPKFQHFDFNMLTSLEQSALVSSSATIVFENVKQQ